MTGTDPAGLRGCVIGLIGFAAVEEQMLLAAGGVGDDPGSPRRWAAVPLVAHNNEFRQQQVRRRCWPTRRAARGADLSSLRDQGVLDGVLASG